MPRPPIPAELPLELIVAVIDTREQLPLDLSPLKSIRGTLATGDYSAQGLEHVLSLERKSLPDLLSCMGQGRERFEREIDRLVAYPVRAVFVEATWYDLRAAEWRNQITSVQARGTVLGWIARGVPFVFCGDHQTAGEEVARLIAITARRRWKENRDLIKGIMEKANEQEKA